MIPFDLKHIGETIYSTTNWQSSLCRDLTTLLPNPVHRMQLYRWLKKKEIPDDVQKAVFELIELKIKHMRRLNK